MSRLTSRSTLRVLGVAVVAIASLVATPSALGAGIITAESPGTLTFKAKASVANKVTVTAGVSAVTVNDSADTITTSVIGCSGSGTNKVECVKGESDFFSVRVELDELAETNVDSIAASGSIKVSTGGGGGKDTFTATGPVLLEAFGDEGDDVLNGASANDRLSGGGGSDTVNGGDGNDVIQGSDGNGDIVNGGGGNDLIAGGAGDGSGDIQDGGPGFDGVFYLTFEFGGPIPNYTLDLGAGSIATPAETDTLINVEDSTTFEGSDTVTGTAGPNRLVTSVVEEPFVLALGGLGTELPVDAGDVVNPLGGPDFVATGAGTDIVNLVDGSPDRLDCGLGTDVVEADQLDELLECEKVTLTNVTPVGGPVPDTTKPICTLKGIANSYRRQAFLRGPSATIGCNEQVTLEMRLTTTATAKGKAPSGKRGRGFLATPSRAGDLVLAETSTDGVTAATLKLRPSVSRALLGPSFSARLQVVARDQAGNATVLQRSIRVKPDRKKGKKAGKSSQGRGTR